MSDIVSNREVMRGRQEMFGLLTERANEIIDNAVKNRDRVFFQDAPPDIADRLMQQINDGLMADESVKRLVGGMDTDQVSSVWDVLDLSSFMKFQRNLIFKIKEAKESRDLGEHNQETINGGEISDHESKILLLEKQFEQTVEKLKNEMLSTENQLGLLQVMESACLHMSQRQDIEIGDDLRARVDQIMSRIAVLKAELTGGLGEAEDVLAETVVVEDVIAEDVVAPVETASPDMPSSSTIETAERGFEIPMYLVTQIFSESNRREQFKNFYETLFVGEITRQAGGDYDIETYVATQAKAAFESLLAVEAGPQIMADLKRLADRNGVRIESWEDAKVLIGTKNEVFLRAVRLDVEGQARAAIAEALPLDWKKIGGKTSIVIAASMATASLTGYSLSDFECFKEGANAFGRGVLVGGSAGLVRGLIHQFGFDNKVAEELGKKREKERGVVAGGKALQDNLRQIFDSEDESKLRSAAMRFGAIYETSGRDLTALVAAEDESVRECLEKMSDDGKLKYFEAKKLVANSRDVKDNELATLAQLVLLTQAQTEEFVAARVRSLNPVVGRFLDAWSDKVMKLGEWMSGRSNKKTTQVTNESAVDSAVTDSDKKWGKISGILKSTSLGAILVGSFGHAAARDAEVSKLSGVAGDVADHTVLRWMQGGVGALFASAGAYKLEERWYDKRAAKKARERFDECLNQTRLGDGGPTVAEMLMYMQRCVDLPLDEYVDEVETLRWAVQDEKMKSTIRFWSAALRGGREDDEITKYLLEDKNLRRQVEIMCNIFYGAEDSLKMHEVEESSQLAKLLEMQKARGEEIARAEDVSLGRRFGRWGEKIVRKVGVFGGAAAIGAGLGILVGKYAPELMKKMGIISSDAPIVPRSESAASVMAGAENSVAVPPTEPVIPAGKSATVAAAVVPTGSRGSVAVEIGPSTPAVRATGAAAEVVGARSPSAVGKDVLSDHLERPPAAVRQGAVVEVMAQPEIRPAGYLDLDQPGDAEVLFAQEHQMNTSVYNYHKQLLEKFPSLRNDESLGRIIEAAKFARGREAMFPEIQGRNGINTMDEAGGQVKLQIVDELMKQPSGVQEAARFLVMQRFSGHGLSNMGIDHHELPGTPGSEQYNDALAERFEEILSGYSNPKTHSAVVRELFSGLQHNSSRMLANNDIVSVKAAKGQIPQFYGYNEFNPHEAVIGGVKGWNVGGHEVVPTVKKVELAAVESEAVPLPDTRPSASVVEKMINQEVPVKEKTAVFADREAERLTSLKEDISLTPEEVVKINKIVTDYGPQKFADEVADQVVVRMEKSPGVQGGSMGDVPVSDTSSAVDYARVRFVPAPKQMFEGEVIMAGAQRGGPVDGVATVGSEREVVGVSASQVKTDQGFSGGESGPVNTEKVAAVETAVELPVTHEARVGFLAREINSLNLGYEDILGSGERTELVRDILRPNAEYLEAVMSNLNIDVDKYFGSNGASIDNPAESLLERILGRGGVDLPKEQVDFLLGNNSDFSSYAGVGGRAVEAMVGVDNAAQFIKVLSSDGSHWDLIMDEKYKYFVGDTGDLYRIPVENFGVKSDFSVGEGMENADGAELVTKIK